jgi:CDP-glucose 4,6-dehydratase
MFMFNNCFFGKSVFVTGHTGFKGSWLSMWLLSLGAKVHGYSLTPQPHEKLFDQLNLGARLESDNRHDIRDAESLQKALYRCEPDFVFHLAAQPLVRLSYERPRDTFEVNVLGTVNVLQSLMEYPKRCSVVIVTTDKCYENKEWLNSYREIDPMGGYDPYSASKGCAELVSSAYRSSFFNSESSRIRVATARAGNVIGGGDWAKDRIVPDLLRAIFAGEAVPVRNKRATRPWQHVLEPLSGYLWLAANLDDPKLSSYPYNVVRSSYNFGPNLESNRTVVDLVQRFLSLTGGEWLDCEDQDQPHEASKLNLAIDKAYHVLGWVPIWDFDTCLKETSEWYTSVQHGADPNVVTMECINRFVRSSIAKAVGWSKN